MVPNSINSLNNSPTSFPCQENKKIKKNQQQQQFNFYWSLSFMCLSDPVIYVIYEVIRAYFLLFYNIFPI